MVDRESPRYPIEDTYPIQQVNAIADKESTGFGRRHYRPIYTIHKWWARRLGSVFRAILLYSLAEDEFEPERRNMFAAADDLWPAYFQDVHSDKVVLDPMMGGGTTIVEALRFGAKVIGSDLNPVAWFVVKKEVEPLDLDAFAEAYENIASKLKDEISSTYTTECPHCSGEAEGMYFFWVKELPCPNCRNTVSLFSDYKVANGPKEAGGRTRFVLCPSCEHVVNTPRWKGDQTCPDCGHVFDPSADAPVTGGSMTCTSCGQLSEVVDVIRDHQKPDHRMYAIEYYCQSCSTNGYKGATERDIDQYQTSVESFQEMEHTLPSPDSEIPKGQETYPRLENHGYERFSDMFNPRQLLNLGKILREIMAIEDTNIQEFMLLAFTNTLKYNCMFAKYNRSKNFITDIFRTHTYHPSLSPVEANCFDLPKGMGSFRSFVDLVIEGKEWTNQPFDRDSNSEKHFFDTAVSVHPALSIDEWEEGERECLLLAQSSEYLGLPDKCVDAVITDPPYKGNVNYAELADFFYVWQRLVLKDRYQHFQAEYSPKRAEVIENSVRGKDNEDFVEGLTAVFRESHRVMKDDGIMAFTFHHKETDAWASVLKSVLEAGFYVTAIYPVRAEMAASTHIYAKGNIEYDMIIVCRKRLEDRETRSWRSIEDEIYLRVEETVKDLERTQKRLSQGDVFTVTMGKCLEIYSKHYPDVMRDGDRVTVAEAISQLPAIVDGQISKSRYQQLVSRYDPETALYLSFVAGRGKSISFSDLNMELQQRGLDLADLVESGLVKQEGNQLRILEPEDRAAQIEAKDVLRRSQVDRAHYLMYLFEHGNLSARASEWATPETTEVLVRLSEFTGNSKKAKKMREVAEHVNKLLDWES